MKQCKAISGVILSFIFLAGCDGRTATGGPRTAAGLQTLVDDGRAEAYHFYVQTDPQFGIEAYRTLVPQGWQATGGVAWNYASAMAPAVYAFEAKSPDGRACVQVISDMHYSEEYANGRPTTTTIAKTAPVKVQPTPQQAAVEILNATTGLVFTRTEELDKTGALKRYYHDNLIVPLRTELQGTGMEVRDAFIGYHGLTGSGTINGEVCDVYVEIAMSGYTLAQGGLLRVTSKLWNILSTCIYYAPAETLQRYRADMQTMTGNLTVNQNWMAARNAMRDEINRRITRQQMADWAAARALSAQLSAHVDSMLDHTRNYSATGNFMEAFSDYMFDRNNYDMGGGEILKVDTKWEHVWMDGGGNVITSNDRLFNPNVDIPGTSGYTRLQRK